MEAKIETPVGVQQLSDAELIRLRAALHVEMEKRKLAFSVGDIGEEAAIDHFKRTPNLPNLQRAPPGTKNVDALSRRGDRFSIKTVWRGSETGTIYPDPADQDRVLFEYLLIVQLSNQLCLQRIVELSWKEFCVVRCWDKRMNAWYVPTSRRALATGTAVYDAPV